jgi:hypothetical protein
VGSQPRWWVAPRRGSALRDNTTLHGRFPGGTCASQDEQTQGSAGSSWEVGDCGAVVSQSETWALARMHHQGLAQHSTASSLKLGLAHLERPAGAILPRFRSHLESHSLTGWSG